MFRTFHVEHDERALLFRKGRLVAVLHDGQHEYFDPLRQLAAEAFSPLDGALDPNAIAALAHADPALIEREFHDVRLGAREVGLRYQYGELVEVLAPGTRRLVFKGFGDARVARFDITERFALPYSLTERFRSAVSRRRIVGAESVFVVEVAPGDVARLCVDGQPHALLRTGVHAFFTFGRRLHAEQGEPRAGAPAAAAPGTVAAGKAAVSQEPLCA